MSKLKILLFFFSFISFTQSFSQSDDVKIANEYFVKNDYEKAYDYYKKLIKKYEEHKYFYNNYITCVQKLNETSAAIKQLEKLIEEHPNNFEYSVDKAILLKFDGKTEQSLGVLESLNQKVIGNPFQTQLLANVLMLRKLNDQAIDLYLKARKSQKDDLAYADELATVYKNVGKTNEMMEEWLNIIEKNPNKMEQIESQIVSYLPKASDQDLLLDKILIRSTNNPTKYQYNELMVWMYMQRKDFYNAYIQLRSLDKKQTHYRGEALIELADVAVKNKDYKTAITIYNYVTETYPSEHHYENTKKKLIQTKEIQVRETYPIDTTEVKNIIQEYDVLLSKSKNADVKAEIFLSKAELYGIFLGQTAQARLLLEEILKDPRQSIRKQAQSKLLLGDMYLLENNMGEAMLLYMQAERMIEDDDLGHIAKLKTAKVFFYDSEFELCKSQLDILKRATTRKIANDAQDLSLLIKGNYDLDTTDIAMSMYAKTDLLIYQKKFDEALETLNLISKTYPNHSLTDELQFQKAQIYYQTKKFSEAEQALKEVIKDKEGILADDAMFQLAQMYDYNIRDYAQAKEYYKSILIDFPGSIYVAEARKRFYEL